LNKIDETLKCRQSPEFWLFKQAPLYYSIYNSNLDHYAVTYSKNLYIDKCITINKKEEYDISFIILRSVNSYEDNKYWKECYKSIRKFYKNNKIIFLDVGTNKDLIKEDMLNVDIIKINETYVSSAVPYLYYLKNKITNKSVILGDTMFLTGMLNINDEDDINYIWQFEHKWDNNKLELELLSKFNNYGNLLVTYLNTSSWKGCFENACVISHSFLEKIHEKYDLYKMMDFINNQDTNSAMERCFAVLFACETKKQIIPICGDIHWLNSFISNSFEHFIINNVNETIWLEPIVKVFK
jgi:hypothetical protein